MVINILMDEAGNRNMDLELTFKASIEIIDNFKYSGNESG